MDTNELKEKLWKHHEDYGQGHTQSLFQICRDCKDAADKIEELQRLVDDMLGDHYIDYLEFYADRCRELKYSYCELCTQYALSMDGTTPNCSYCDLNNKNIMH